MVSAVNVTDSVDVVGESDEEIVDLNVVDSPKDVNSSSGVDSSDEININIVEPKSSVKNISEDKLSGTVFSYSSFKNDFTIAQIASGYTYVISVRTSMTISDVFKWGNSSSVRSLVIYGNGNNFTFDGEGTFLVYPGYSLTFNGFGFSSTNMGNYAVFENRGSLSIVNSTWTNFNYNRQHIISSVESNSYLYINNTTFIGCNSRDGCIDSYKSRISIVNSNIIDVCSKYDGGFVNSFNSSIFIENCSVTGSRTSLNGGLVYASTSNVMLNQSSIKNCFAKNGGVVYLVSNSICDISYSNISNCMCEGDGALAYIKGIFSIYSSNITGISSKSSFVYADGSLFVFYSVIDSCHCWSTFNSALFICNNGLSLFNSTLSNNKVYNSLILGLNNDVTISGSKIVNNSADSTDLINCHNVNLNIEKSVIMTNNARTSIINCNKNLIITSNNFTYNHVKNLINASKSNLQVYHNRFIENTNFNNSTLISHLGTNYHVYNNTYINNSLGAYITTNIPYNLTIKSNETFKYYYLNIRYDPIYNQTAGNVKLNIYLNDIIYKTINSANGLKFDDKLAYGIHSVTLNGENRNCTVRNYSFILNLEKTIPKISVIESHTSNNEYIFTINIYGKNNTKIANKSVTVIINDNIIQTTTNTSGELKIYNTLNVGCNKIKIISNPEGIYTNNTIKYDKYIRQETSTQVLPINAKYNDTITLTATVKTKNNTLLNEGYMIFKVNGITLKDSKNKTLQVAITDYKAEVKYHIRLDKANYTATYLTNDKYTTSTSTSTINLTRIRPQLQILTGNSVYKAGDTVIFQTLVTYNGKTINNGQLNYKLNGITIKDSKGVPIKVNVTQGVATLVYTIPQGFLATNYTLTAVFGGSIYNRSEVNSSVRVVKTGTYIQTTPIRTSKNTATLTAKIYDTSNTLTTTKTNCVIKIDGTTIKRLNITNGIINTEINTNYLKGIHTIEIIAGENHAYQMSKTTTYLIKE